MLELKKNLEKELEGIIVAIITYLYDVDASNNITFPQNSHIGDFSSVFKTNVVSMVILNQYNVIIDSNDKFKELSGLKDNMNVVFKKLIIDPIEEYEYISCLSEVYSQSNITSSLTAICKFPNNRVYKVYIYIL